MADRALQIRYGYIVLVGLLLAVRAAGAAQIEPGSGAQPESDAAVPIYRQDPFDLILLKDGTEHKVIPLALPGRQLPQQPRPGDVLVIRLYDEPAEQYEVAWRSIERVVLFEQMILDEAAALLEAGQSDVAYDYYDFLRRAYPEFPGVAEAVNRFLFLDGRHLLRAGRHELALAMFQELAARDASYAGLGAATAEAAGAMIDRRIEAGQDRAAFALLDRIVRQFPREASILRKQQEVRALAGERLGAARQLAEDQHWHEAQQLGLAALELWPAIDGGRALVTRMYERFPTLLVGVTQAYDAGPSCWYFDWAQRRTARLEHRNLIELARYGPEGGDYICPLGELTKEELGLRLRLGLRSDVRWSGTDAPFSVADVAHHLAALARPGSRWFRPDWADTFASVETKSLDTLSIELVRAHVLPEALLVDPLAPWDLPEEASSRPTLGPYRLAEMGADRSHWRLTTGYFAAGARQPQQIIERTFASPRAAISALRRGEIQVLDRVCPWDLAELAQWPEVVVRRYGPPTVHCLIPNPHRPLSANRTFRRALQYALDREAILRQHLLRGRDVPGCQVIDGPFPVGYGYNDTLEPRPYEPRVARTLVVIGAIEAAQTGGAARDDGADSNDAVANDADASVTENGRAGDAAAPAASPLLPVPDSEGRLPLRLAHPPHEAARVACRAIAAYLDRVGLKIELVPLDGPLDARAAHAEHDLLYAELAVWEPVVDARRLLGSDGVVPAASPYLDLALRQLDATNDWRSTRDKLQQIHRLAHEELPLIPLWQMTEHFAHRANVEGTGSEPVTLYQHIEQWSAPPEFPAVSP